jgi:predicted glycogen debranching enzyme
MQWPDAVHPDAERLLTQEWLLTNGLGGYASGTIAGTLTRRYHGLLVAALPAPWGRVVMLSQIAERMGIGGEALVPPAYEPQIEPDSQAQTSLRLVEFRLETGLPIWRYAAGGTILERRILTPQLQNTVYVTYHLVSGDSPLRLELRPLMNFRPHGLSVGEPLQGGYELTMRGDCYEISASPGLPPLRLCCQGAESMFAIDRDIVHNVFYRSEAERGYEAYGSLLSPGYFSVLLAPGLEVSLVASTEPWSSTLALPVEAAQTAERARRQQLLAGAHPAAQTGPAAELVLAASQFIIRPATRLEDSTRTHTPGDEEHSVIAGYHWFTDWGRDTMISLEGLTLTTGRHVEAGSILRAFARFIRHGLIPNLFPEGEHEGLYHTADATLWFFHALDRYLEITQDHSTLDLLLPKLLDIVNHHRRGTLFGIGVDPQDHLLRQGQEGYQLTWMDAKVDDWVVTPRRGKAVEINALWYNALRLLAGWGRRTLGAQVTADLASAADQTRKSFNERFWYAEGRHLYDVIDGPQGNDASCRPNQVLAISLRYPILDHLRWESVITTVRQRLVTPVGLRTLAADHPDYKARYFGDLRARDAAYHQGTVWPWLIGPFIDAWLRVYPTERAKARGFLEGLVPHLGEACLGTISEIFDAEPPFTPRGCVAQAWSVAELLRGWVKTAG